jgi:hypothetical protein
MNKPTREPRRRLLLRHGCGYKSSRARAASHCALHGTSVSLASPPYQGQTYYPATLHLLAMVAARDRGCLKL